MVKTFQKTVSENIFPALGEDDTGEVHVWILAALNRTIHPLHRNTLWTLDHKIQDPLNKIKDWKHRLLEIQGS